MTLDLDPDRRLALAYVPVATRPAMESLWRLDVTLASVLAAGRDPMVSRLRLAWWRESLEKLDQASPPSEPMLQAAAQLLLPAGLRGAELGAMETGWSILLDPDRLGSEDLDVHAAERGGRLFGLSARLLGSADTTVDTAGEAWALIDLARHSADVADARAASVAARQRALSARAWPPVLRPLGMLAVLAAQDARRGPARWSRPGSPARMLRMMHHRFTGR